jgi:hypothetical protein
LQRMPAFAGMTNFTSPEGEGFQPSPKGTLKQLIRSNRQLTYAFAGSMIDGIRDSSTGSRNPDFADTQGT